MILDALLATATGLALGLLFYGGLWWTVRQVSELRHPALTLLASLLLRSGVVLAGFYWVAGGDWRRLLLCLLGFLIGRLAVTWATRLPSPAMSAEAKHAS
jgi:F1F0 ATPase subunit 2